MTLYKWDEEWTDYLCLKGRYIIIKHIHIYSVFKTKIYYNVHIIIIYINGEQIEHR